MEYSIVYVHILSEINKGKNVIDNTKDEHARSEALVIVQIGGAHQKNTTLNRDSGIQHTLPVYMQAYMRANRDTTHHLLHRK